MKIISGDEFGIIKLISTKEKKVVEQYGSMDSSKSIVNIFSNFAIKENDSEENSEISEKENLNLFVSSLHENYVLNWDEKRIISSYNNENPDINFISSTIKFPSTDNKNTIFINGTSDNKLEVVTFNEENEYINNSSYIPLDKPNIKPKIILKGVSNSVFNKDCIYSLYKNSPLVLYNIQEEKIEFKGKNLPNDELNLVIPMYDTDIVEVKNNPRLNYVSTAYGEIRLYDKKASPRPSLNKKVVNSKINKIYITDDGNYLFIGDNLGYCAMLDIRKNFSPCRTFRGNTGSIQTLLNVEQNNNIIVGGFDRFVKWYDYKNGDDGKVFVKNKVNSAILVGLEKNNNEKFEDEEEGEIEDSELLEEDEEEKENEDNENSGEESDEQNQIDNNKENEDEEKEEEEEENEEQGNEEENEEEDDSKENNTSNNQSSDKYEEDEDKNEGNKDELEEDEEENVDKNEEEEEDSNEGLEGESEENDGKNEEELDEDEEQEENSDNNKEEDEEDNSDNNKREEEEENDSDNNKEEDEEDDSDNNKEKDEEDDSYNDKEEDEELNKDEIEESEEEEESEKVFKKRKREKSEEEEEEEEEDSSRPNKYKKRKLF